MGCDMFSKIAVGYKFLSILHILDIKYGKKQQLLSWIPQQLILIQFCQVYEYYFLSWLVYKGNIKNQI